MQLRAGGVQVEPAAVRVEPAEVRLAVRVSGCCGKSLVKENYFLMK